MSFLVPSIWLGLGYGFLFGLGFSTFLQVFRPLFPLWLMQGGA
jgi:hypothetical protein